MGAKGGRLDWVDTAKGLSILLVVMMHSAYGVGEETGGVGVLHWIIAWATPFRMPEFFLISGLFLGQVIARDWARYADRRVVHYLYFYALWAVIQIVFKVGLGTGDPATAASFIAWAVIEPYGVLWFIYLLAVFSALTKMLFQLKVPHWLALGVAAALQIAPITTGSGIIDQSAEYFVFFYAGYAFAPAVLALADTAGRRPALALVALCGWAVVNGMLVFSAGFQLLPLHTQMGYADIPGVRLVLALIGSLAVCVTAALIARVPWMSALRWLGEHSIVVYLSFSLPMAITRVVLLKVGLTDTSLLSIAVMAAAVSGPLVLYALIQWTGRGRFLFERPSWAHLPGTGPRAVARPVPAE